MTLRLHEKSPWTQEAIDELKRLHGGGLFSAEEIAQRLTTELRCNMTRNAVIGKVYRMGLENGRTRGNYVARPRKPRGPRKPRVAIGDRGWQAKPRMVPVVEPIAVADEDIPTEQRCTLDQFTNETCRWPLPGDPVEFFCGKLDADLAAGRAYCWHHFGRAYQASAPRRPYIPMRSERV